MEGEKNIGCTEGKEEEGEKEERLEKAERGEKEVREDNKMVEGGREGDKSWWKGDKEGEG